MEPSTAPASSTVPTPPGVVPAGVWPAWQRFAFAYLVCHWLLYSFPRPFVNLGSILLQAAQGLDQWLELGVD